MKLQLHDKFLKMRAIHRIILSDDFANIFPNLTDQDKVNINDFIKTANKLALEALVKKKLNESDNYEELPVSTLRIKARDKGIKGWQYLTKAELLSELYNARRN